MSDDLKPCPFCGGVAESEWYRDYRHIRSGEIGRSIAVYCTACHADMTICRADVPELSAADIMATLIEAWNRRAPESRAAALSDLAENDADLIFGPADAAEESSVSPDGRPPGDTPWKRFRDEKPTHDGWGERYLLTWNVRSATYDHACIDGEWRVGEEIDGHADDLWRWLDVNPERHLAAPAEARSSQAEGEA